MPKIFITKTTVGYDSISATEILAFLDESLKNSIIFDVTQEELVWLRKYYENHFSKHRDEIYAIHVIVDNPTFKTQIELAKTFALEEQVKQQKRMELQKKKAEKSEKTRKQNLLKKEKELLEKLKKKFESEETCGKCNGTEDKFHSTKCINFYK